jgi:hypothetical protein
MKKSLTILLVLIMTATFVACDNHKNDASDTGNTSIPTITDEKNDVEGEVSLSESLGVDESEWDDAIQSTKFDNVTFTYNATFTSGYDDVGPHIGTMKIDENGMLMNGELASDESKTAVKTMFVDTVTAIVNDFSIFEYDEQNNNYRAIENITYNTTIMGYETTIIAENVIVIMDNDNNIAKITCKMTQNFNVDNGNLTTYVLDTEFAFTDYGTTTLE